MKSISKIDFQQAESVQELNRWIKPQIPATWFFPKFQQPKTVGFDKKNSARLIGKDKFSRIWLPRMSTDRSFWVIKMAGNSQEE